MTTKIKNTKDKILEIFTGCRPRSSSEGGQAWLNRPGVVSALAVMLGFLVATLLLIVIGRNPAGMYQAIVQVVSGFD